MAKSNAVIIKKGKKEFHSPHGGAWKVAYADFVTAMMAFFLLLWLLNATTDKQKRGIADYFAPTLATQSTVSGADGVLGGKTMMEPGSEASNSAPPAISDSLPQVPANPDSDDTENYGPGSSQGSSDQAGSDESNVGSQVNTVGQYQGGATSLPGKDQTNSGTLSKADRSRGFELTKLTEAQFKQLKAQQEQKQFQQTQYQLRQAIQSNPDLKPLAQNLIIDQTPEGLRIQIVDQAKVAMFALGSTELSDSAKKLLALVAKAVSTLPNQVALTGHTDGTPYINQTGYSNWELSADRANAARRILVADGMPQNRIATVVGKADTDNLFPKDPTDPRNRRISIVVLRENTIAPAPLVPQSSSLPADTSAATAPTVAPVEAQASVTAVSSAGGVASTVAIQHASP
jgi:chemotaxis protein MotB